MSKSIIPGLPIRDIDGELWLVQMDIGACFSHYSEALGHQETYWHQAHIYWSKESIDQIKQAFANSSGRKSK